MEDKKTGNPEKKDWLKEHVSYLEKLKTTSKAQALLIELYKKPNRTSKDDQQLGILKRAEKAAFDAATARAKVTTLLQSQKKKERSARTHRLIQHGLLIEGMGLHKWDRQELVGALHNLTNSDISDDQRAQWKQQGKTMDAQKEANAKENDAKMLTNALLPKKKPTKKASA